MKKAKDSCFRRFVHRMTFVFDSKLPVDQDFPRALGPFETLVRWSGFDLSRSDASKAGWAIAICTTSICLLLTLLFTSVVVLLIVQDLTPLSLFWADVNFTCALAAYGLASAICVAIWTRGAFLETFQEQLQRLRSLRVIRNEALDDYTHAYRKVLAYCVFIVATWALASMRGILYVPVAQSSNFTQMNMIYSTSWKWLFGLQPIVYLWIGVATAIGSLMYSLVHEHLLREMTYFNEELLKASRAQQLTVSDVFAAYGRRHMDLMLLLHHMNAHLGTFASFCSVLAVLASINGLYVLLCFKSIMTIPYGISIVAGNALALGLVSLAIAQPARVQEAVYRTSSILLDDVTIPTATDQRIIHSYRMFMDRCSKCSTMYMLNAFQVDRRSLHKVILIIPSAAAIIILANKLINHFHI